MPSIAIVAPSSVPFVIGGAEKFWWGLHKGLTEHAGAHVELVKIPCKELTFPEIVNSYKMFSRLDLSHFDMIITSKYPAWMVSHPKHLVYMQHTLRGLYDTYHFTGLPETVKNVPSPLLDFMGLIRQESPGDNDLARAFDMLPRLAARKSLPSSLFAFPGPLIRELVHFFDRCALAPEKIAAYAAISGTVKKRPGYFPSGVDVKIVYHPADIVALEQMNIENVQSQSESALADEPGEYIFTVSRLTNMKRLHLVVEAMRHVSADIRLLIAGEGAEAERLKSMAKGDSRIVFLGYVPDARLPELYKGALFVPFVPYDEDYGLITIEAMRFGKPVLTVADAGGVREFVVDGKTGYCVAPAAEALGAAMQKLASDPCLARKMGRNARDMVSGITWEHTVTTLLTHTAKSVSRNISKGRDKILVATTFPASHPVSGGPLRVHHLCRALAKRYFVQLVCIGGKDQSCPIHTEVAPHFHEIILPWSPERAGEEERLADLTGANVGDIACMETCARDEKLAATLRGHGADATLLIASHPYLYPALQRILPHTPLVYDAHNVEADMKAVILDGYEGRDDLVANVAQVEQDCCRNARRILVCSHADAERFASLYGIDRGRMLPVPNGYDDMAVTYADQASRRALRKRLGCAGVFTAFFMGSWHRPNIDAVTHIRQIAHCHADVRFLITGSVCHAPGIRENSPANMYFLGVISDKEKNVLLHAANLALNPITSGSGTNLKIVEYLASGLETLSTPFGLRGLGDDAAFLGGVRICDVEEFSATLHKSLSSPLSETVLATAARHTAKRLSWRNITAGLPDDLAPLLAREDRQ